MRLIFFKEVLVVLRREDYRRWILWEIFAIKVFNMTLTFLEFSLAAFHVTWTQSRLKSELFQLRKGFQFYIFLEMSNHDYVTRL